METNNQGVPPQNSSRPIARVPKRGKPEKVVEKNAQDTGGIGLGKVLLRNEFYRDGYRLALRVAVVQSFIIVGLIFSMLFVIKIHQPENRYFATTEDGRLIPMIPLSEPNLSRPALLSWVTQAATEVMTFGFNDFRRRLQEASRHFTGPGWQSFTKALQEAKTIDIIQENTQVITATPRGAPVLESEGIVNGQYQWIVQIPMLITYESGAKKKNDNLMVSIVIVRVSRLESPNGVGISQWIARPG
ncbi:MAG: type IV secretion protein IcmL [Alphaproteobacteria bacterium]|nr:type IV secretion protein IcmL [Alphaproteobacteria bacterium]NCQ88418.1 type IV secretion protein IcmL [Alphaproteobacteria bacterium]NCT05960.1 type IV secretion protein IcmL [Alphaproteobacteria bacterium]